MEAPHTQDRPSRNGVRTRGGGRRILFAGAGILASGLISAPAAAAGFYIQEQSVRGAGRAYSGEAADVGVQSIWWNPAAIARLHRAQAYAGAQAIWIEAQVNDAGSTIHRPGQAQASVGGEAHQSNPLQAGLVPSAGAAYPVGDRAVVGISVTSPFNSTNKYAGRCAGLDTARGRAARPYAHPGRQSQHPRAGRRPLAPWARREPAGLRQDER